ncbi:hypothetical protein G9A89_006473 [Geosiphon pyriformis]|nr:hypothetical protein G9A89_006473 [Geosiphon pyriformis]
MANKLLVAAVNKLLGFDKLVVNILVVDRLVAALLVGKWFNIVLSLIDDLELRTGDRVFDIDFPIIGYLNTNGSRVEYVFVYHNSGRYAFSVATVDWLIKMNVVDFGHN